jgi:hypothetical protein
MTRLPATPERVMAALREKRSAKAPLRKVA